MYCTQVGIYCYADMCASMHVHIGACRYVLYMGIWICNFALVVHIVFDLLVVIKQRPGYVITLYTQLYNHHYIYIIFMIPVD